MQQISCIAEAANVRHVACESMDMQVHGLLMPLWLNSPLGRDLVAHFPTGKHCTCFQCIVVVIFFFVPFLVNNTCAKIPVARPQDACISQKYTRFTNTLLRRKYYCESRFYQCLFAETEVTIYYNNCCFVMSYRGLQGRGILLASPRKACDLPHVDTA